MLLASSSYSAVSGSHTGKALSLRVEAVYGFLTLEGTLPWAEEAGCNEKRVWIDISEDSGKLQYSTALAALAAKNNLYVRAYTDSNKIVFGACKLYDIIIYPN